MLPTTPGTAIRFNVEMGWQKYENGEWITLIDEQSDDIDITLEEME